MNLKDFKKVHEDDQKAVLQNSKGHSFTIAKKALSRGHLENLKKLPLHSADGNIIPEQTEEPMPVPQEDIALPVQAQEAPPETSGMNAPPPEMETPQPQRGLASEAAPKDDIPQTKPQPISAPSADPIVSASAAQTFQKSYDQTVAENASEFGKQAALFHQDLTNGHIQPETYRSLFGKKDTVGKVGTLFGLLLSGAGSGLSGQPNAVLMMMQNEIDNDLKAQEQSKSNAQNFLKINQANEMNKAQISRIGEEKKLIGAQTKGVGLENQLKVLTNTKMQMQLSLLHDLTQNTNKLPNGSPMKAAATQALNGLQQLTTQGIQQESLKAATQIAGITQAEYEAKTHKYRAAGAMGALEGGESLAKDRESKELPGVGYTTKPVPQDVQNEIIAKKSYDQAAKEYVEFAKKHQTNWANLNPIDRQKISNEGAAMAANLQNKYRDRTNGGVWKAGEQHFIESSVPSNPAKWSASFNSIPKVEQTIKDNQSDINNVAKGYGTKKFSDSDKTTSKEETAVSKSGKPMVKKNGKWVYR